MYVKSILVGVAAFLVAVIISGVIAIGIVIRFPDLPCASSQHKRLTFNGAHTIPLIFLFGRRLSLACWHSSSLSSGWSQGRRRECEYWHVCHPAGSVAVAEPDEDLEPSQAADGIPCCPAAHQSRIIFSRGRRDLLQGHSGWGSCFCGDGHHIRGNRDCRHAVLPSTLVSHFPSTVA